MVTFPRKKPNKSSVCSSTGTSFATGFPRFVITTVSRFAWTSSIRAKQWTLNEPAAIFLTISSSDHGHCTIVRKCLILRQQYPEPDSAREAVTGLLREISSNPLQGRSLPMTIAELCDHFVQRELTNDNTWRSHSTKRAYRAYLKRWVTPHWGTAPLSEVRTMRVESWLRRLPLAKSSCAKIRGLLSVLFNHACRYEFFDRNPIRLVRQGEAILRRYIRTVALRVGIQKRFWMAHVPAHLL